jgi:beta-glucosidase
MTDSAAVRFPKGFVWGCATSAYQIEGSPLADGAGPSIWHQFVRRPGAVRDGDTGDTACDHYRRMHADVALMRELGLQAYRFSIAWGRVMPEGRGRVNPAGLAFYERLVDALLAAGIEPMATLYHWDLPAALNERGGWLNPDIASWFGDYAELMFRKLDHGVRRWVTLNEPWVVADGGYLHGELAPGHRSLHETPIVSHQLLRAHAEAVRRYRAIGRNQIGIVVNIEPKHPATDSAADHAACARADAYMNRQYLDPLFFGRYPESCARSSARPGPTGRWPRCRRCASPSILSASTTTPAA